MVRTIVQIDEDKCDGCGLCVPSCHEGAIQIIDGKARLRADQLCDGLGACLGECPRGAITLVEREAEAFDEAAVVADGGSLTAPPVPSHPVPSHAPGGCPGSRMLHRPTPTPSARGLAPALGAAPGAVTGAAPAASAPSELRQWPVQLHLVNPLAPYYHGADVVLAADCSAFAAGDFHSRFLKGKALAIACPKLDSGQERYAAKIQAWADQAGINTLTVVRMEVPCCFGLTQTARQALAQAQRRVPLKEVVIDLEGGILSETWL